MKKLKKVLIWAILAVITIFLVVWLGSLCRNYLLTAMHGDDLKELNLYEGEVAPEYDWMRIISYSETEIEVYYVNDWGSYEIGGAATYRCNVHGDWFYRDSVLWSTAGTAETLIWPYWHHAFYYVF